MLTQMRDGKKWLAGAGPVPSATMLVFQSPTLREAESSVPFTSEACATLGRILKDMGHPLESMYRTYAVKYSCTRTRSRRPPI